MESLRPEQFEVVQRVFLAARGRPRGEWGAVIESGCGGDADVARTVQRMLERDRKDEGGGGIGDPVIGAFSLGALIEGAQPGGSVGQYRILRLIGRGGQGEVYEAEQANPSRRVALKIIAPAAGLADVPAMLRRFEREAGVLAKLRHPGIAQVYEAGIATGPMGEARPFFAMELVHGRTLLKFASEEGLDLRARLTLMGEVCAAVQYAHQQGVIHRDLKPENILVETCEGGEGASRGRVKIVDFGVARITEADSAVTMRTTRGELVGTLKYMSPEQAGGEPDEIDTRSDVYALGVICYELLAGRPPYELVERAVMEAVRVIREEDPPRLSSVDRVFKGDIETIVGKAMAKEKGARYQSAQELAGDIARHLASEPITARRPTPGYYMGKMARRHPKTTVAMGAMVAVIALLSVFAWRQYRQVATVAAHSAKALGEAGWRISKGGSREDFLEAAAHYQHAHRVVELIGESEGLSGVDLISNWGTALYMGGEYSEAVPVLERAWRLRKKVVGEQDSLTRGMLWHLAESQAHSGMAVEAEASYRELLRLLVEKPSPSAGVESQVRESLAQLLEARGATGEALEVRKGAN